MRRTPAQLSGISNHLCGTVTVCDVSCSLGGSSASVSAKQRPRKLLFSYTATVAIFVAAYQAVPCSAQEKDNGATLRAEPSASIQAIHSKATVAREKDEFDKVEQLRLQRLQDASGLPDSSAWKRGADAIVRADKLIAAMQYQKACDELLEAWKPFEEYRMQNQKAVVFGDLVMKLFQSLQSAQVLYTKTDPRYPRITVHPQTIDARQTKDARLKAKEVALLRETARLRELVDIACESDPCQVEILAARAFLTSPDPNETFLTQPLRPSITRRNRDLLKISYPPEGTGSIEPWHGPAQLLLGESSSFVIEDLRFLRFLDASTRIRGIDRVGESFQIVLGGAVLCFGVSERDRLATGRPEVRHFVDDYRDGTWHRQRPYLLEVKGGDLNANPAAQWFLREADVKARITAFLGQLTAAESRLSSSDSENQPDPEPAKPMTAEEVMEELGKIQSSFRQPRRRQVEQAIQAILGGQWSQPAIDGTPPPGPGASLQQKLAFLEKGFLDFASNAPDAAEVAGRAATRVRELAAATGPADQEPALEWGVKAEGSKPPGPIQNLGTRLTIAEAASRLSECDRLLIDWDERLTNIQDAEGAPNAVHLDEPELMLRDYRLILACRGTEACIYRLRVATAARDLQRLEWKIQRDREADATSLFGKSYKMLANEKKADSPEDPKPLDVGIPFLDGKPVLEGIRNDVVALEIRDGDSNKGFLTADENRDILLILDQANTLCRDRLAQLRGGELREITDGKRLYAKWTNQSTKCKWSVYEFTDRAPADALAELLDSPFVPILSLDGGTLENLRQATQGQEEISESKIGPVPLITETSLPRRSVLVQLPRDKGDGNRPTLRLGVTADQLPLFAVVLAEHNQDSGEAGKAFGDEDELRAQTPETHRLIRQDGVLKSEFPGCDGFTVLGIGRGSRYLIDRRGNKITARSLSDAKPFRVVSGDTKRDISEEDKKGNVVYFWSDWRALDQNVVNEFLPSTKFFSPSLAVLLKYREEYLRRAPQQDFRWGPARTAYYREDNDFVRQLRQTLGW